MNKLSIILGAVAVTACAAGPAQRGGDSRVVVDHPSKLSYPERELEFPDPAEYRHVLSTGDVVYVVEDHSLPLVEIGLQTRAGAYLIEDEAIGVPALAATMLRDGGTAELSPEDLDERLDFLATSISFGIGDTSSTVGIDTLSANLEESVHLTFDMLTEPRWDAGRLSVNKDKAVEAMRRRNDDTRTIEPREWARLIYGEDFFANRLPRQVDVTGVDSEDLSEVVDRVFTRGNFVIAVSGDTTPAEILPLLEAQLARLPKGEPLPPIPDQIATASPGLYGADKPEVTQTRVTVGHPGVRFGHPDQDEIAVMNEILGGGGFTSRITSRVRSDEGLAYSAGSAYTPGLFYPGQFRAAFQSKNATVDEALAIVFEEIQRIREEPVSQAELELAKQGRKAFVADLFSNARKMASRFAADEINGYPADYWTGYEARVMGVTAEDVRRAAQEHLRPEHLIVLLTGNLSEVDVEAVERISGHELERVVLRDPLTLQPLQ